MLESFRSFADGHLVGKLQEVYSGFFDLNSICHPYIGYQLFGENYKRSIFLVELPRRPTVLRDFEACASEIPDRLSIVLRFAAQSEGEDVDALLTKGLLPALERMTTKPETESHQHGHADTDGDTGMGAKLDDRELRKQRRDQQREARKQAQRREPR